YGERYTAQRQRMADLPAGCELLPNPGGAPGFAADGVYAFPGFPRMLQPMARALLEALLPAPAAPASVTRDVTLAVMEGDIALAVEAFCREHPRARVGIYPAAGGGPPAVTLRLRAAAADRAAQEAFAALVERLRDEFAG
ncbi:MAG TPA: competence/damage-inducible protein A, partial [Gammaproteobacteria bacterium]